MAFQSLPPSGDQAGAQRAQAPESVHAGAARRVDLLALLIPAGCFVILLAMPFIGTAVAADGSAIASYFMRFRKAALQGGFLVLRHPRME